MEELEWVVEWEVDTGMSEKERMRQKKIGGHKNIQTREDVYRLTPADQGVDCPVG